MRFEEFLGAHDLVASPVDRFGGFVIEVGMPPSWLPFETALGLRVWVWRNDPRLTDFGANAVLTMHRVGASLEEGEVFAMLADQQVQSVPNCLEMRRSFAIATEGAGVVGLLELEIMGDAGVIDSVSRSRIVATRQETWIAQLTVTALHESRGDREGVWMTVREGEAADLVNAQNFRMPTHKTPDES